MHSFRADVMEANRDWVLATSDYGGEFVAALNKGEVYGTQFHPEKSGEAGLDILASFFDGSSPAHLPPQASNGTNLRAKCIETLAVRPNALNRWRSEVGGSEQDVCSMGRGKRWD